MTLLWQSAYMTCINVVSTRLDIYTKLCNYSASAIVADGPSLHTYFHSLHMLLCPGSCELHPQNALHSEDINKSGA